MLALLEAHRVLTTDQLRELVFDSLRRTQQRMTELYELGVVWRFRYPLLGGGSQPWHYTLGYQGARLQAAQRGDDPPRPQAYANRLERLAESPKLRHLIGANDFFVMLAGHARCAGWPDANSATGDGLRKWLSEQQVTEYYEEFNETALKNKPLREKLRMRPDGYGHWGRHGRYIAFHLEHDTGTETLSKVADKVTAYTGPDDMHILLLEGMILFWLHSTRREQGLRELLARTRTVMPVATAARDFGHPDGPAGPVWLLLDGPRTRVSLEQLPVILRAEDGLPGVLADLRREDEARQRAIRQRYPSY